MSVKKAIEMIDNWIKSYDNPKGLGIEFCPFALQDLKAELIGNQIVEQVSSDAFEILLDKIVALEKIVGHNWKAVEELSQIEVAEKKSLQSSIDALHERMSKLELSHQVTPDEQMLWKILGFLTSDKPFTFPRSALDKEYEVNVSRNDCMITISSKRV
jgi:hypothetical protein